MLGDRIRGGIKEEKNRNKKDQSEDEVGVFLYNT
jgi:hypothetical protein